ncbi:MAG TPA: IPT/TIG domain-containing protein [Sunxiuqinia sp.]|nr:IPT/TIG domain-containing protein [Sunxiuqinia sp.]
MKAIKLLMVFFFFVLLFGCEKEAIVQPKYYPFIQIEKIVVKDNKGVNLSGTIVQPGISPITEAGFVISLSGRPTLNDRKAVAENDINGDKISCQVSNDLLADTTYYVRAYVKTDSLLIYSAQRSFFSKGCLPPEIKKVAPMRATAGSSVTIIGNNFGATLESNTVYFGNRKAKVVKATQDSLVVMCPDTEESVSLPISLEVANSKIKYAREFELTNPWIRNKDFVSNDRIFCSSCVVGDYGYTTLGKVDGHDIYSAKTMWQFSSQTKEWVIKKEFPAQERGHALNVTYNGKIYLGMGVNDDLIKKYNDLWSYNPKTDEWERKADFPGETNMMWPIGFTLNNKVYVFVRPIFSESEIWTYDPIQDQWEKQAFYPNWSVKMDANLKWAETYNGKGYCISNNEIWEFDPSDNQFALIKKFNDIYYADDFFHIDGIFYIHYGNKLKIFELKTGYTGTISCPLGSFSDILFQFSDRVFMSETYTKTFWEFDPEQ